MQISSIWRIKSVYDYKMKNYLGLSPEKDRGYAYVIIFCSSLWSGFFLGYVVNFQLLTAQWKLSLGIFDCQES